jgi:hypothetical protein
MTAPELEVPEGFFEEIAAMLDTETAEEISDAVITVCTRRGILHPELDEDPADELRTEQIREVFTLLGAVTAAVSDGTIIPSLVFPDEDLNPALAALWDGFVGDAADPAAADAVAQMVETGRTAADSEI